MFSRVPERKVSPKETLFLVLGCISQEIRNDSEGCRRYGTLLGEKIAEEAGYLGMFNGEESAQEFIKVFTARLFPLYFMCELEVEENGKRKETVIKIDNPSLLKHCREKDICEILSGTLYSISQRILKNPLRIKSSHKNLLLIISWIQ